MRHFLPNFLLFLLVIQAFLATCCVEHEREALLQFKAGIDDPSNRLASWSGNECCSWAGVRCSNITGHVVKLDLQTSYFSSNVYGYPNFQWNNLQNSLSGNITNYVRSSMASFSNSILQALSYNLSDNRFQKLYSSYKNFLGTTLSSIELSGIIPPQLGNLSKLRYLDLSYNNLNGMVPPRLGNISKLQYLDLSYNNLNGVIPPQLGNLFKLQYLNLCFNNLNGMIPPQLGNLSNLHILALSYMPNIFISNVWWLSHLTSLRYLHMTDVDFQDSKEWAQALITLPLLQYLYLGFNNLTTIPASITMLNFSPLEFLFVNWQNFNTRVPDWIWNLTTLIELNLWSCSFIGPVPNQLGTLTSLNIIILGGNRLEGVMPPLHNLKNLTVLCIGSVNIGEDIRDVTAKLANDTLNKLEVLMLWNTSLTGNLTGWLSQMPNLAYLDLSYNNINGTIPIEIGNLTSLEYLYLHENAFTGEVSEKHLTGLPNLKCLELDSNSITITVDRSWVPPFQLESLSLGGCKLGPHFPSWLQNQSQMTYIDLSNTRIDDTIPDWFWKVPSLSNIDLSHNNISGMLPLSLEHLTKLYRLVLSNNQLGGGIPSLPNSLELEYIDLSYNLFSGPLPHHVEAPSLSILALSNNYLDGTIEQLICGLDSLTILNLAKNNFYGNLPHCWPNTLEIVNMAHNKFSGAIPSSMGSLNFLWVLQLNNNSLTGELPSGLQFCRNLTVLDIGENHLFGQIPKWIGESLNNLTVLRLRSNMFTGKIPIQIMHLTNLQVLDLASNHISGLIPHSLELLMEMASSTDNENNSVYLDFLTSHSEYYNVSTLVVMKDLQLEYTTTTLSFLRSIDLSGNNLTGEVPKQITTLLGLRNLNLSNNHINGSIPAQIGQMQSIESLDLHMNNLSGTIPESMSALSSLEVLNLSYNNLSGSIPTGHQLQMLDDPSIYMGNPHLCGPSLEKSCSNNGTFPSSNSNASNTEHTGDREKLWLYLFTEFGFVVGFLVVVLVLLFKSNWRWAYFQMFDNMFDKLYVFGALIFKRLRKEQA